MALTLTAVTPSEGPLSGIPILLTGTEFVDETIVIVGDIRATEVVAALDGLTLTALAPPHSAGLMDISVVNPTTFPVTLVDAFTYVPGQWAVSRIDLRPRREQSA
jgi:hypothetical protein